MPSRFPLGPATLAVAVLLLLLVEAATGPAATQPGPSEPPAVGVVEATRRPITRSNEFIGRVQAVHRVDLVARVTAFLEERLFDEGAEVKTGDLLHGDANGVTNIPIELASEIADVAEEFIAAEAFVIGYAKAAEAKTAPQKGGRKKKA